jgi:hypothetical protein
VTLLEVAVVLEQPGVSGVGCQGLLVMPLGFGIQTVIPIGLVPLKQLLLVHLTRLPGARPP